MSDDDEERKPSWHNDVKESLPAELEPPQDRDLLVKQEYAEKARRLFMLALSRKSKQTIRSYEYSIKHFAKYLNFDSHDMALGYLLALPRVDAELRVYEYMGWMEGQKLSPSTIRTRLAALKFYCSVANRAQWIDWTLTCEGPKQEVIKKVVGPTPEQFIKILEETRKFEGITAQRNRLIVYMLSFMALRLNEILSLDIDHVDLERKRIHVLRKGSRKQRAARTVPDQTLSTLRAWIAERKDLRVAASKPTDKGPLFINGLNPATSDFPAQRLSSESVRRIIKRLGERADVPGLHPHAFRHFSTTEALEVTDGHTRKTMKHTGHSTEKMVSEYEDERQDEAGQIAQSIEDRWLQPDLPFDDDSL